MRVHTRPRARLALAALSLTLAWSPVFGQAPAPAAQAPATQAPAPPATQAPAAPVPQAPAAPRVAGPSRPITIDDAVRVALEQNLDVQVERLNPQLQALAITQARTGWTPTFSAGMTGRSQVFPSSSALSGSTTSVRNTSLGPTLSIQQVLPIGTSYTVSFDSTRSTTNNIYTSFNPSINGNLNASLVQPLLRNFKMNALRYQEQNAEKNREISDVALQQRIASTIRSVKNAYWDYKYALASLDVARQSLDLARESLRNTRSRVEIGTLAPIDIVQAESEVAAREEAVITAEASIGRSEDALRQLVFDPGEQDVWNTRLDPIDPVPFLIQAVDVDSAVRRALEQRTDLVQSRKTLERTGVADRYYRNQSRPDLTVRLDYTSTALAGTRLIREGSGFPPPVVGEVVRPYVEMLGDIFTNTYPTWAVSVNLNYPIGTSAAEASLARTRVEERQQGVSLRNQELSVVIEVRDAARSLLANSKRVDATRSARVLAERRLEAEEKKFAAGMSTSFQVFQAQRDLSTARNNELRAVLDYTQSQVDYDTVQIAPVAGGTSVTPSVSAGNTVAASTGAAATAATPGGGGQ